MAYKNLDLRRQRARERYAKNREVRQQAAREYYARNVDTLREKNRMRARESREKYKDRIQEYCLKNKDRINARCRAYYHEHKESFKQYYTEHRDELRAQSIQAKLERKNARVMCPAFKFVDKIRLKNIELYTTKYKPNANLAHRAKCPAIIAGDYSVCPICCDCSMTETQMKKACPMSHVFEFENAVATIREHAADIVIAHQK